MIPATSAIEMAIKDAIAAPLSPSFGKGPIPIINRGSRMALIPVDIARKIKGVTVSPIPRRMAVIKKYKYWNINPARRIRK